MNGGNSSFWSSLLQEPVLAPTVAQRSVLTFAVPSSPASEKLQNFIHNETSGLNVNPVRAFTLGVAVLMVFIIAFSKIASSRTPGPKEQLEEPPLAPFSSAFFYHVGAILRLGPSGFLQRIRKTTALAKPYTVVLGPTKASGERIYAFNHPMDLKMVFKNATSFTWLPVVLKFTKAFAGHSQKDEELVQSQVEDKNSWFIKFVKRHHLFAVGGKSGYLDEASKRAGVLMGEEISKLANEEQKQVELGKWLQKSFFRSTAGMYFGSRNFYEEAEDPDRILESYQIWENSIGKLTNPGFEIFNKIFYSKIIARREDLFAAHRRFLEDPERLQHALTFIRERKVSCEEAGYSIDGHTRADLTLMLGSIANARNTIYWSIYHAFAGSQLLSDIKSDLETHKAVNITPDGIGKIHMPTVIEKAIHLKALFHEVLRIYQDAFTIRLLKNDTSVKLSDGNSYRLKKNGLILINSTNLYSDPDTWGNDADVFNAYRFINPPADKDARKLQDAAFRPFGGGLQLCPGRKLAYAECAAFVAALVSFFDVQVPDVAPRTRERDGLGVLGPADDCLLNIEAHEGIKEIVLEW